MKHAAHCIRLLNMGIELARTGRMSTRRPDAEAVILMGIKAGDWSKRRTMELTEELWSRFQAAEAESDLPEDVDREHLSQLLVHTIRLAQRERVSR